MLISHPKNVKNGNKFDLAQKRIRLKAVNYFRKTLHFRFFTAFWVYLCPLFRSISPIFSMIFQYSTLSGYWNVLKQIGESLSIQPAITCMFKVNNRNTRTRCEISSKLIIKTPEGLNWPSSSVSIVNFE